MKSLIITLLYCSSSLLISAQAVIGSAGQLDTAQGVNVDWNVGEVVIETGQLNNHVVTQGFEQPHYLISSVEQNISLDVELNVFPNPTSEQITIEFSESIGFPWSYNIMDERGRLVKTGNLESQRQEVALHNLAPAKYFILLQSADKNNFEKLSLIISH